VVRFSEFQPGLFVVPVRTADDLSPVNQAPLVEELERALKRGKAGIVFEVDAAVRAVELNVPTFWLGVTGRLPLAAIAIVTSALLVKVAARGFAGANRVRGLPTRVEVFTSVEEATAWVAAEL
jgi:hypothetical protein